MAVTTAEAIEDFAAGVAGTGVPKTTCELLVSRQPDGDVFAARTAELIPQSTLMGRVEIITVAIELADDPRYRPLVERLLDLPSDVSEQFPITITDSGATLRSEAVGWWFDTLAVRPAWSHHVDRLVHEHPHEVLAVRHDAAVVHLTTPGRSPSSLGVWAAVDVLCALGRVPVIEASWLQWIHVGRFDGYDPNGAEVTTTSNLAVPLWLCVEAGVFSEDHVLVRAALEHWAGLIRSDEPGERRLGLRAATDLIRVGERFPATLPRIVDEALGDDPSREADLVRTGIHAHFRRDQRGAEVAYDRLVDEFSLLRDPTDRR